MTQQLLQQSAVTRSVTANPCQYSRASHGTMPNRVQCRLVLAAGKACAWIYSSYLSAERMGEEVQVLEPS